MVLSLSGLMTIRNILAYSSIVKKILTTIHAQLQTLLRWLIWFRAPQKFFRFPSPIQYGRAKEMWVLITPVSMHTNKSTFNPPQQMWYRKFVFLIIEWRFWQFCINIFLWRVNQRFKLLFVYKSELVMMLTSKFDVNGNTIVCRWNEISWKF